MLTIKSIPNRLKELVRPLLPKDRLLTPEASNRDPSQLGEAKIVGLIIECLTKQGCNIPKSFLEIGANSPYHLSSSWYLEKSLGFEGVSIDPISDLSFQFSKYRPKTKFINKAFSSSLPRLNQISFYRDRVGVLILDIESLTLQLDALREIIKTNLKPFLICVETLDFSPSSANLRSKYDSLLGQDYTLAAGTYLNSIYTCKSLLAC